MGQTQGFKVRVGVVLPQEGKLLLVRQNHRDFWVFPGGTLEPEEDMATCAVREMQEETGLTVRVEKLLYVADWLPAPDRHVIEVFFLARPVGGTLTMATDENLNEIGFFPPEALLTLPVYPELIAQAVLADSKTDFSGVEGRYLGHYG